MIGMECTANQTKYADKLLVVSQGSRGTKFFTGEYHEEEDASVFVQRTLRIDMDVFSCQKNVGPYRAHHRYP